MSVKILNEQNFVQEVLSSKQTVLVDFYADWCGPCQMMAPVIDEIADERQDIKVCKLNIDENETLAKNYRVMSIPCLVVFKNGKEYKRSVGVSDKEKILSVLE